MIKRLALGSELGGLDDNEQPQRTQSPLGFCLMVCFVSLALFYLAARPAVSRMHVWWAELLIYALVPTIVTFVTLYRSGWHREITGAARTFSVIFLSCIILGGAMLAAVVFIILGSLVYSTFVDGFARIHY